MCKIGCTVNEAWGIFHTMYARYGTEWKDSDMSDEKKPGSNVSWDADGSKYVSCGHSIFISCHRERHDFASSSRYSELQSYKRSPRGLNLEIDGAAGGRRWLKS